MSMFNRNEKDTGTGTVVGEKPGDAAASAAPAPKPVQPSLQPAPAVQPPPAPQPVRSGNAGPSVISKALKITGQLESTEDIRIDGEVEGDIHGVSVTVGNGAKVKGSVYGQSVELAGTIEGKIEAKKVILTSTAHMAGDVIHQDIKIESGAYIDGHCRPGTNKIDSKPAGKPN
jgi:cytoskeletal protein CcmA (bactofilin family)